MPAFDELHDASFDAIKFDLEEREVSGGRAFARRRYPYRDGQSVEDTGRDPYHFSLTIPLFEDIDPTHYPDRYNQLRAVFDDPSTQGEAEYVDPELGPLRCKVVRWTWQQTSEARHGGRFRLELEEVSFDDVVFAILPSLDARSTASLDSILLDDTLRELGVEDDEVLNAMALQGLPVSDDELGNYGPCESVAVSAFRAIDEEGATVDEMQTAVGILQRRLDAVTELDAMQDPSAYAVLRLVSSVISAVSLAAEEAGANAANVMTYETTAVLSAWDLAVLLYEDGSRAEELVARNPTRNPLAYPVGYSFRFLSR